MLLVYLYMYTTYKGKCTYMYGAWSIDRLFKYFHSMFVQYASPKPLLNMKAYMYM